MRDTPRRATLRDLNSYEVFCMKSFARNGGGILTQENYVSCPTKTLSKYVINTKERKGMIHSRYVYVRGICEKFVNLNGKGISCHINFCMKRIKLVSLYSFMTRS